MLKIENLHASVNGSEILKGIALEHLIDQADGLGFVGADRGPQNEQFEGLHGADDARQALGAAGAGNQAQGDFRQADSRGLGGDSVVAGERRLQAAGERPEAFRP